MLYENILTVCTTPITRRHDIAEILLSGIKHQKSNQINQ